MTDLPRTPEGRLIRRARELAIPKLSIRAAAARIGMSHEQWGYAERGYLPSRGGAPEREFHPPADTLARMAHALGSITPERLESEGGRPDAAGYLRGLLRPGAQYTPGNPFAAAAASLDDGEGEPADDAAATYFPDDLLKRVAYRGGKDEEERAAAVREIDRLRRAAQEPPGQSSAG